MTSVSGQIAGVRGVLAVDGLPLGTEVVLAQGKDVVFEYNTAGGNGRPLPLEERVIAAVDEVKTRTGVELAEVRLLLVDDGEDGALVDEIADRLALDYGLLMTVMHPGSNPARRESRRLQSLAIR